MGILTSPVMADIMQRACRYRAECYARHWELEGPQHEPVYLDGQPIYPDNPPRFDAGAYPDRLALLDRYETTGESVIVP